MSDPTSNPDQSWFVHDEEQLAIRLGLDRGVVREARGQRGVDFIRGMHGRYLWTEKAASGLAESLGVKKPAAAVSATVLHVASVDLPHVFTLACVEKWEERHDRSRWKMVRVRPDRRGLFLPGMRIAAEAQPDQGWRYLGPENFDPNPNKPARYPRIRGKW